MKLVKKRNYNNKTSNMEEDQQAKQASIDYLMNDALKHYDEASSAIHHWNNQIPQAIKAWYESKRQSASARDPGEKYVKILKTDLDNIRFLMDNGIPEDCCEGFDEVKFCSQRNGDGNKCLHCISI